MDSIQECVNDVVTTIENETIQVHNMCGLELLQTIPDKSVDLILTDPPYITSRDTGMNSFYNTVKENEKNGIEQVKTEEEWLKYKKDKNILNDDKKHLYIKYGTIYGNTYSVKTDYGDWDKDFSLEILDKFINSILFLLQWSLNLCHILNPLELLFKSRAHSHEV